MEGGAPDAPAANYSISVSAELMTNYAQNDVLQPQKSFSALQTTDGHSLLFSISTDGALNVVVEQKNTKYGWEVCNLSERLIRDKYAGVSDVQVGTFAVSQPSGTGSLDIRIAMVVLVGGESSLYLSLNNSDSDLSWTHNIEWVAAPFNAVDDLGAPMPKPAPFVIEGIMLADAQSGENIVVDIARGGSAGGLVSRWFMDVVIPEAPKWKEHRLPADLEVATYSSCIGRKDKEKMDGVYSIGQVGGVAQLVYVPLWDYYAPTQAPPVFRLQASSSLVVVV
jgi:hypothetical protein